MEPIEVDFKIIEDEVETVEVAKDELPQKPYDNFKVTFTTQEKNPTTRTVTAITLFNIQGIIELVKSQFQKKSKIQVDSITNSNGKVVYTHEEFVAARKALEEEVERVTLRKLEEKRLVRETLGKSTNEEAE